MYIQYKYFNKFMENCNQVWPLQIHTLFAQWIGNTYLMAQ
jgi:hypothetical protein